MKESLKFIPKSGLEAVAPATLAGGCVALLQWHSIEFWTAQVDSATGWAWSLLLEAVALWLWYRPGWIRRSLAGAASLLLLIGPLYVVSGPAIEQIRQMRAAQASAQVEAQAQAEALSANVAAQADAEQARAQAIPVIEQSIRSLEKQLAIFLANSRDRSGWLPAIQQTQVELTEQRQALTRLTLNRAPIENTPVQIVRPLVPVVWAPDAGAIVVVVMQCLALILYQVTGILAIRQLSARAVRNSQTDDSPRSDRSIRLAADLESPPVTRKQPMHLVMY